ncbi:carboxypeptidase regulatory-like domain-containing protein [Halorientalis sp. IM1011]|uniref:carboxypeptidase regulatory-like domain-containing protein n=1 Tax=Halorientalis sp. IM1011 TaxID=1932360 RepID=UPI0015618902|nr:carboxypeptidase regulatory-like domain-containing protein [Halorientalis sp. IM1011]
MQANRKLLYSVGLTALLIAVVAMGMVAVQPAAATGVSTQTTDEAEFGNVTAEVTKETLFTGKVSKVEVTYTAPEGETVDVTVADKTKTVTADGTESSVTLRVGAFFFFGEEYPVNVSASIQGGETVEGQINEDDGVVTLKSVDDGPAAPANFDVTTPSSNSPVVEGETLTVDATVENTGESAGTQTVELNVAGSVQDSQEVDLDAGGSEDVSLSWTTAEGDAGNYTATVSSENDSASTDVTVTESVTTGTIEGTVTDDSGSAIEGATVSADGESTTTAADGSYSLTVEAGDYTVEASANGYESDSQNVTVNAEETTTANFSLTEIVNDGTIEGTVTDDSGSAIEGATVSADGQSTTTAADGSYSLTVEEGDYTVEANADGYQSDNATVTVTAGETTSQNFSLSAVQTDGTIEGTVTDASDSAIEGATVSAGGQSTTTAADGSYSLTVEEGDYTVEATADGYEADNATVTVTAGETTSQNFSLSESGPVYQSFTAWAESGYLQVGNNSLRSDLPDCPNGVPENESKGCVKFTADYDPSTGDYTVSPENFQFPPIPFDNTTLGTVPANNTATDTITGNLNAETGEASFNAPIFSYLEDPALDDSCGLEVNVEGTTGESGALTGEPGPIQDDGTARATLVDGTFSIPAATQETCGFLATAVNNDVGLPAPAGENEIVQNLYIEFSENSVENNPDAPSNSGS